MASLPTSGFASVPILGDLGTIDHYTVCVENAQAACDFHVSVLGFKLLRTQHINSGTVPVGEIDMLNFVLALPSAPQRTCIITEGLNDRTLFRRFVKQTGGGIHHVAYQVSDIDEKFARLRALGYTFTSDEVLCDPLSGLRQVFIGRQHVGYFLELIERVEVTREAGLFTENNMRNLTQAMESYLLGSTMKPQLSSPVSQPDLKILISCPAEQVLAFLTDPANMHRWTTHRTIRHIDSRWQEIRRGGDVEFAVLGGPEEGRLIYKWSRSGETVTAELAVQPMGIGKCQVVIRTAPLPAERLHRLQIVIGSELRILKALMEGREQEIAATDLRTLEEAHLEVYLRAGL